MENYGGANVVKFIDSPNYGPQIAPHKKFG
jgi:hypothetical protein